MHGAGERERGGKGNYSYLRGAVGDTHRVVVQWVLCVDGHAAPGQFAAGTFLFSPLLSSSPLSSSLLYSLFLPLSSLAPLALSSFSRSLPSPAPLFTLIIMAVRVFAHGSSPYTTRGSPWTVPSTAPPCPPAAPLCIRLSQRGSPAGHGGAGNATEETACWPRRPGGSSV